MKDMRSKLDVHVLRLLQHTCEQKRSIPRLLARGASEGPCGQLWQFPGPLVVAAGFYGSESSPKMVSTRPETARGPVFGRVSGPEGWVPFKVG